MSVRKAWHQRCLASHTLEMWPCPPPSPRGVKPPAARACGPAAHSAGPSLPVARGAPCCRRSEGGPREPARWAWNDGWISDCSFEACLPSTVPSVASCPSVQFQTRRGLDTSCIFAGTGHVAPENGLGVSPSPRALPCSPFLRAPITETLLGWGCFRSDQNRGPACARVS